MCYMGRNYHSARACRLKTVMNSKEVYKMKTAKNFKNFNFGENFSLRRTVFDV